MEFKDYYQVLGVEASATAEQIRQEYLNRVKFYHPDVNPGERAAYATQKMKEVNEAYDVLKNELSRADYDFEYKIRRGGAASTASGGATSHVSLAEADFAAILAFLTRLDDVPPSSPESITLRDQAVAMLTAFIAKWPDSQRAIESQYLIVRLYSEIGIDYDLLAEAARKLGRMAEDNDVRNYAAWVLANVYYRQRDYDRALNLLESLETRYEDDLEMLGNCLALRVRIHTDKGDQQLAHALFLRLKRQIPDYPEMHIVENWMLGVKPVGPKPKYDPLSLSKANGSGPQSTEEEFWGKAGIVCTVFFAVVGQIAIPIPILGFIIGGVVGFLIACKIINALTN